MYKTCIENQVDEGLKIPSLKPFELDDQPVIREFVDIYQPSSCEYNYANLYSWRDPYQYTWMIYQERLVVYDGLNKCAFMPLGEALPPEALAIFSLNMMKSGLSPDIGIVLPEYLEQFPEIEQYYTVRKERDYAEYIYSADSLSELNGTKLHKKRNLISQFHRLYPGYAVQKMEGDLRGKSFAMVKQMMSRMEKPSRTLEQEFSAFEQVFSHFDQLGFKGLVLTVEDTIAAFSIFTRLNRDTYNIQFEKSNQQFKGTAQMINRETAAFLKEKCTWLNREQDLGIKGLRQAKMSYEPETLLTPNTLIFNIPN